ncbi:MAG: hypothetical protein Tp139SUR460282_33 [Prokaryotic dsDNA virus sp.]|jgi:hypothetical protein|nr:MAG: hypothetical protein Tp139SUR460282_33 [Prokaryotic dsDNA virus sp.]|tara:strand:+ start:1782 stop:1988 length:207 start_codon:yes stop_codon:yes gene_type:complete
MKVKAKIQLKDGNITINPGDVIDMADANVDGMIKKGWVEPIKKEVKQKKETKEMKLDSKETKNATSKD